MSGNPTIVRYTLSEIEAMRARGEDATREDAPEGEFLGDDFWDDARVVLPRGMASVRLCLDNDIVE